MYVYLELNTYQKALYSNTSYFNSNLCVLLNCAHQRLALNHQNLEAAVEESLAMTSPNLTTDAVSCPLRSNKAHTKKC